MTHEKVIEMIDEYILQDNINEEWVEALKVCRQSLLDVEIQKAEIDILIRKKDNLRDEISKLEYTIVGIMHSVDKWLDEDELKQDEVNRAITMREKTLQITEEQQAEIERLQGIAEVKQKNKRTIKSKATKEILLTLKAEAESSDKFIREYDDSKEQKAYNQALWKAYNLVKEMTGDNNG